VESPHVRQDTLLVVPGKKAGIRQLVLVVDPKSGIR
jgi:hypothetical protein